MSNSETFPNLFPITLGGNTFGWTSDEATSFKVLDAYVQAGGNHIDSADSYSAFAPGNKGGESETVIGNWLASRGNRSEVFVATKVSQHPQYRGLAADNIRAAIDQSLRRLRTDYVDLYYAHNDDPEQDIADIAASFDSLVRAGKVLRLGVSNMSPERITSWMDVAEANGLACPVAIQPHYNLLTRDTYEQEYEPLAQKYGLTVFPYFSLAAGFLTGKYRTPADVQGADRERQLKSYGDDHAFRVVDVLVEVADEANVAPATVALAWQLSRQSVTGPIASARVPEQLPDVLAAVSLRLSSDQVSRLEQITEAGRSCSASND
jgi:aryl-alcohol dehydrogenase-like predicted oxidoreductase